ncbi:MAG TPA: RDD family protein, partial [Terriglobales bacterium]|nr:RDD family protein [Terriglobales bacterium]
MVSGDYGHHVGHNCRFPGSYCNCGLGSAPGKAWKGQTPGKRLAGIRAIKNSGRALNVYEVIGRNLLRAVDWLP